MIVISTDTVVVCIGTKRDCQCHIICYCDSHFFMPASTFLADHNRKITYCVFSISYKYKKALFFGEAPQTRQKLPPNKTCVGVVMDNVGAVCVVPLGFAMSSNTYNLHTTSISYTISIQHHTIHIPPLKQTAVARYPLKPP